MGEENSNPGVQQPGLGYVDALIHRYLGQAGATRRTSAQISRPEARNQSRRLVQEAVDAWRVCGHLPGKAQARPEPDIPGPVGHLER
ncbi:hypothetical protein OG589_13745 [Sphaerisporangium sp. NBC_01403]|uniref:hypothetical protein n=1 Tax=Sphaerisporangium sp. NBC_01403 TaxID=2903599 RepID=UPI00324A954D